MKAYNIHITGVGGQGIGLLSQALLRGIDHAGITAIAVDTHGLAQRGGVVVSRIRCGQKIHSPLILQHSADLVLGMEVHEALRGLGLALKPGGTLVYLDVSWQPLLVRLGLNSEIGAKDIEIACKTAGAKAIKVDTQSMEDSRMQNMALLGTIAKKKLIPGVSKENFDAALEDLLTGDMLKKNRAIYDAYAS
ncbi:MAG: 2-oxoacid:acceptor oxidoreductase family protein [Proteobacteria bacterium]|nr:2-oxoacid:acceptor oxidoreductase family protein [Pseudomonadota bacterium]MBU1584349.1 2-oxoacid:acceptor oxidoreductase family protein [Pseudomonadota bacterium]MBU2455760.1 2-oxoacid:acceptor oxidoreductase family protein [Pseudomonadota bacterium]MBU2627315.1 2-oxoacid:acceptor oxidoreductase family protein [Pseudomonadota bacterium]